MEEEVFKIVAVVEILKKSSIEDGHSETKNGLFFERVFVVCFVEIIYFFRCIVDTFVNDTSMVLCYHVIVDYLQ